MSIVWPTHYKIHLVPDLPNFKFTGKIDITFHASQPVSAIELDSLDITYHSIKYLDQTLDYEIDLADQKTTITLPTSVQGNFILSIEYSGDINDKLAGLYRSRYEINGEERYVAVTQFQESDARRAFPCYDSPEFKAKYDISYTVPREYQTISNTSIQTTNLLDNNQKVVVFETTPKMSSYLVFFAFGQFEWVETNYNTIPLRLITAPGKAEKYGSLGLDYGKKSLQYCENYFGIPYPLSKMDLLATPDFAAGAMENWGAILFRENALLYYPGMTTEAGRSDIKITIAHEIAHQWFGNLVSPDKWKYVWLNESFATYFSYKTMDHFEPEYGIFDYFIGGTTDQALSADGYIQTAPIEQEGDEPAAYTVKTVPILYSKGSSVLRQLEGFLGNEMFQSGLRHYLKKHEYDVAGSKDLWKAFETVSNQPVTEMMDQWVMQMGYPQIDVKRLDGGLSIIQSRFSYIKHTFDTYWFVPITLRQYLTDGSSTDSTYLMKDRKFTIELDPRCHTFKLNIAHTGFYRVLYEEEEYQRLAEFIETKSLTAMDRFNIENDLYAFVRSGSISLEYYLNYLSHFKNEDNHLPLASISNHLNTFYNLLDGNALTLIKDQGSQFYESFLDHFGYDADPQELHNITMMRGPIINRAAKFGVDQALQFAKERLTAIKQGQSIDPNILPYILAIAAREDNDWEWFVSQLQAAESEAEKQYYTMAMSNFSSAENIEKLQLLIFDKIPGRNRGHSIAGLCNNPNAKDTIWEWYLANLDNFEKLHPFIYQSALMSVITASVNYREEVVTFFDEYVKKSPQVKDPVDKALETMEIRAKLQNRYM